MPPVFSKSMVQPEHPTHRFPDASHLGHSTERSLTPWPTNFMGFSFQITSIASSTCSVSGQLRGCPRFASCTIESATPFSWADELACKIARCNSRTSRGVKMRWFPCWSKRAVARFPSTSIVLRVVAQKNMTIEEDDKPRWPDADYYFEDGEVRSAEQSKNDPPQ